MHEAQRTKPNERWMKKPRNTDVPAQEPLCSVSMDFHELTSRCKAENTSLTQKIGLVALQEAGSRIRGVRTIPREAFRRCARRREPAG